MKSSPSTYQPGSMLKPDAPKFDQDKHDPMVNEMVALAEKKKKLKEEGGGTSNPTFPKIIEYLKEEDGIERGGLKAFVSDLKAKFQTLDDVYVWHA